MTVKSQLVPIMVSLSTTGAPRLQSQIGEAVAEIAELDFPERWPNLIDVSPSEDDRRCNLLTIGYGVGHGRQLFWRQLHRQQRSLDNGALNLQKVYFSTSKAQPNICLTISFGRWRSQFQSNELFSTIKTVLEKFCKPYTELFQVRRMCAEMQRT